MSTLSKTANYKQAGISLIELIIFIVIISISIVGILSVMNVVSKNSADPMLRKQALSIAEALLEEIQLQPFTYCFPTDTQFLTASSSASCTGGMSEDVLPAAARLSVTPREATTNNVADYNNFSMNPIKDIAGTSVTGLGAYTATVTISQVGTSTFGFSAATANDALQINVHVISGSTDVTMTGYRFRYAPKTGP